MTIPELRFKADDGSEFPDWEGKKLGDNVKFINGRAYSQDELLSVGKYQVLRVGNLFTNDTYYYSNMELEPDKYIEDGDLIYAWSATFGPRIYIGNKCIYHYHIWKLKFDENIVSKTFLNYILERDVEKIMSQRTGGTMVHITKSAMENRELFFPSLPEQKKIASFLSTIDDIITTTEAELTAWQERKKGVMQKIFNREVRFKADDGSEFPEWEEKRLGELYCKNVEKNTELKFESSRTISIASMQFNEKGNGANEDSLSSYKVLRLGDIAFEGHENKEYSHGRFVLNDIGDGIMSPRFSCMRPVCTQEYGFWKYYIHSEMVMRNILVRSTKKGTMMHELVISDFLKQSINVPSLPEQRKIADCLSSLDDVINQIQAELSAWKEFKKGLLQQMFV